MKFTFHHDKATLRIEKKHIDFSKLEKMIKIFSLKIYESCRELDYSECEDEYRTETFFSFYALEKRCKSDSTIIEYIYHNF